MKALGHEYKDGKCVRCGVAEAAVSENQAQTPKTGDENQMGLYMIAMILASACLAGTAVTVKNKRYEDKRYIIRSGCSLLHPLFT